MMKTLKLCKLYENEGSIKETDCYKSLLMGIGKSRWKRNVGNHISFVLLLRLLGFLYRSKLLII